MSKHSPSFAQKLPAINELDSGDEHSHAQNAPIQQFSLSQIGRKLIASPFGKKQSYSQKYLQEEDYNINISSVVVKT